MQKLTALFLMVFMVFGVTGTAWAQTPEEILQIRHYFQDQIDSIQSTNKMSNDEIYSVYVDLNRIPQGSVTATVYENINEQATTTTFANIVVQPIQGINGAHDKITRFWSYLDNNNDEVFLAQWGGAPENTVIGYAYGVTKTQTMTSFVTGIPECLGNVRIYDYVVSSGDSDSSSSTPTTTKAATATKDTHPQWAEAYLAKAIFTLSDNTFVFNNQIEKMDVAPYIKDNLTYLPVRYLAYSLGVKPEEIAWNQADQKVTVTSEKTIVEMTIGSNIMTVNGTETKMDVAPEIKDNRTMLPARWLGGALGAKVTWNEQSQSAIIETAKPGD
ncbi:MAG: copper amine oxidase N-terminal domain-containing protein [Syntrophomonas sp.]